MALASEPDDCGLYIEFGPTAGVVSVMLNKPERRNALDTKLINRLVFVFDMLAQDASVRVVVLSGTGTTFCAGADLTEFRDMPAYKADSLTEDRIQRLIGLMGTAERFPKPLIAAIEGAAVGAGARLAMAADMVCMGETASLSFPELAIGRLPSLMAAPLVHTVGYQQAFALLIGGQIVDSKTALALGLAQRIATPGTALPQAMELARTIATLDPTLVRSTKSLLRNARCGLPS